MNYTDFKLNTLYKLTVDSVSLPFLEDLSTTITVISTDGTIIDGQLPLDDVDYIEVAGTTVYLDDSSDADNAAIANATYILYYFTNIDFTDTSHLTDMATYSEVYVSTNFENIVKVKPDDTCVGADTLFLVGGGDCLLWKNPAPASSMNWTDLDLYTSVVPYKYLKILVKNSTTASDGIQIFTFLNPLYPKNNIGGSANILDVWRTNNSGYTYVRRLLLDTATKIVANQAYYYTPSGSSTASSTPMIPFEIWGSNKL